MSSHADTIRKALRSDGCFPDGFRDVEDDAYLALEALLAENQDVRQLLAVTARENKQLRADSYRLREALIRIVLSDAEPYGRRRQEMGKIAREALAGDAE